MSWGLDVTGRNNMYQISTTDTGATINTPKHFSVAHSGSINAGVPLGQYLRGDLLFARPSDGQNNVFLSFNDVAGGLLVIDDFSFNIDADYFVLKPADDVVFANNLNGEFWGLQVFNSNANSPVLIYDSRSAVSAIELLTINQPHIFPGGPNHTQQELDANLCWSPSMSETPPDFALTYACMNGSSHAPASFIPPEPEIELGQEVIRTGMFNSFLFRGTNIYYTGYIYIRQDLCGPQPNYAPVIIGALKGSI